MNNAIVRRALKHEFNENVKLREWEKLFDTTMMLFKDRWSGAIAEADELNAYELFCLYMSQAVQKLVKTACQKIRSKEQVQNKSTLD